MVEREDGIGRLRSILDSLPEPLDRRKNNNFPKRYSYVPPTLGICLISKRKCIYPSEFRYDWKGKPIGWVSSSIWKTPEQVSLSNLRVQL